MDHDIIKLLEAKDQKAISLVEERYQKLIRYIAGTILFGRETAIEECVNDVYMKIWMYGARYDYKKAAFKTYIIAITRITALNHLRKVQQHEEQEEFQELETMQEAYIDYKQNPEHQVIQKEEVKILEDLLKELKKKDKELVLRRFYYLQSTKQIAAAMKMSENAVDSKLSRLRKKIKKHYDREVSK